MKWLLFSCTIFRQEIHIMALWALEIILLLLPNIFYWMNFRSITILLTGLSLNRITNILFMNYVNHFILMWWFMKWIEKSTFSTVASLPKLICVSHIFQSTFHFFNFYWTIDIILFNIFSKSCNLSWVISGFEKLLILIVFLGFDIQFIKKFLSIKCIFSIRLLSFKLKQFRAPLWGILFVDITLKLYFFLWFL